MRSLDLRVFVLRRLHEKRVFLEALNASFTAEEEDETWARNRWRSGADKRRSDAEEWRLRALEDKQYIAANAQPNGG